MSKLPENAKKVFQGEIFALYQWPQKMYDGSIATFEKLKRADTVIVIGVTKENKFIVSKQSQPTKPEFWGLCGGRVEENENNLVAAKREFLEESGYASDDFELYFQVQPYSKIDWTCFYYIAKNCQKIANQNLDSGEKIEIFEYSFNEFVELCLDENFREKELQIKIMKALIEGKKEELRKMFLGQKELIS